ncbi:MAG TPA: hypothetical protein VKR06_04940 [Ktedonosporobacter sp.]|nr:hypothetical protein [Ktedonosporobacter sp.]
MVGCTKTVCDNLHGERILSLSPVVLLKIEIQGLLVREEGSDGEQDEQQGSKAPEDGAW